MIIRTKVLYSTSSCSVFLVGSEEYYFALDVAKNKERNLGSVIYTAAWLAGGRWFKPRPDQNPGSLNN